MKAKKVLALVLAGMMAVSVAACGETESGTSSEAGSSEAGSSESGEAVAMEGELVVWALADDLKTFGDKFMEMNEGVTVETVVISPADYPTKVQTALLGGATEPDIIVGEPQMLETMYEAGFFEDLNQAPYNAQDYAGQIVDYVWEVGQDEDGIQRAISYQITPAGMYYRRDIADEVFGFSDPESVSALFESYETIVETGRTLKEAGYRIFASDGELNFFSGDTAWVIDGKLNVDQARYDYMDLCVQLYQEDLTAYASQWAAPWYQAMGGEVPILTAETQWGTDDMNIWDEESFNAATEGAETTEVFAFGLPSWGTLVLEERMGDTAGNWGVAEGPSYGFGGGTYIGINSNSERKDLAWEYVKFCTLDPEVSQWWVEESDGDTVSLIATLENNMETENATYGNQKLYAFWLEQAEGIDYSLVTKYDTAIGNAWGAAISAIKTGAMTQEEAINGFYDEVASVYPEIEIVRE